MNGDMLVRANLDDVFAYEAPAGVMCGETDNCLFDLETISYVLPRRHHHETRRLEHPDSCQTPDRLVDVLLRAKWSQVESKNALSCGGVQILRWREQTFSEEAPATFALEPESTATDSDSTLMDPFVCSSDKRRQGSG